MREQKANRKRTKQERKINFHVVWRWMENFGRIFGCYAHHWIFCCAVLNIFGAKVCCIAKWTARTERRKHFPSDFPYEGVCARSQILFSSWLYHQRMVTLYRNIAVFHTIAILDGSMLWYRCNFPSVDESPLYTMWTTDLDCIVYIVFPNRKRNRKGKRTNTKEKAGKNKRPFGRSYIFVSFSRNIRTTFNER